MFRYKSIQIRLRAAYFLMNLNGRFEPWVEKVLFCKSQNSLLYVAQKWWTYLSYKVYGIILLIPIKQKLFAHM